jgi:MOSC domain-containing protein YiiM
MQAVLDKDSQGNVIRRAGIMAIVLEGGEIFPGDEIKVTLPPEPYQGLELV